MKFEYINKDISWLSFNERVLDEAADCSLSISERLRFLAIFSNNFDEFYHFRLSPYIKKEIEVANEIFDIVVAQQNRYVKLVDKSLFADLKAEGISFIDSFDSIQSTFLEKYFKLRILPNIHFVMMQKSVLKDYPLLDNTIYLMVKFSMRLDSKEKYALVSIPKDLLSRFVKLDDNTFVFVEDVIRANMHLLFPSCCIYDAYALKVLRHLDLKIKEDGDACELIRKGLEKRKKAKLSAMVYDRDMPRDYLDRLVSSLKLSKQMLIPSAKYLKFSDFFSFNDRFSQSNKTNTNITHPLIEQSPSIRKALKKSDILLHYPYHSFDYLVRMLQEAIIDKRVVDISITWYRVAKNSVIANLLIAAARNKKKVRVVIELKAKMEEDKNLAFAREMRENGVEVIITSLDMKVHSKMLLIRRVNKKGDEKSYCYLSTGNFNEITARAYTDHALLTRNKDICDEVFIFFNEIESGDLTYDFKHVLVSPVNLKDSIACKIQREIDNARTGKEASFTAKMNGLTDFDMIDLLYKASLAGVKIKLMVRGMCSLLADKEYSKNITLVRIVDQYLEHGRIYYFYNDGSPELFMGSADLMPKKLNKRVELIFPVLEEALKQELMDILEILFADNNKMSYLFNGNDCRVKRGVHRAQLDMYKYLKAD